MQAIGAVRDGRVHIESNGDDELIEEICSVINDVLSRYTVVYRSCIYDRYQSKLAARAIYTESVMTQQLLKSARGRFYSSYQVFTRPGKEISIISDCRQVLRNYGGAMAVSDVAKELWFVPYDIIYHSLLVDNETLNVGTGIWMLAEHFPITKDEADKVGDILDEYFLSQILYSKLILYLYWRSICHT